MGLPQFTKPSNDKDGQSSHAQQPQQGAAVGAGANTGAGVTREKTEAEKEADRLYEERMEDEYAKREGGA
ncbi:unnamed protein product [Clonostachys solani]|uniref:Uncharacterized protein n=1 Tax=Clonostachys solani TaxID=160281 RepID=A0A9N9Z370_9HYPO|nr:unnamed protein product [Clonostachys solani]